MMAYSIIVTAILIAFAIYHWVETARRDERERSASRLSRKLREIKDRHHREDVAALEEEIRILKSELPKRCKSCGKFIKDAELCDKCFHAKTGIPEGDDK